MNGSHQDERRKHTRFSDRILAGSHVTLFPVAPLYGEPANGHLVDLSAGGMAFLMPDIIPRNVLLKMNMTLADGYLIDSVITVKHVMKQGHHNDFLHGIEFLNPSPEMIKHIEDMAKDILACNQRTKHLSAEICVDDCIISQICRRPQRVAKNVQPALAELIKPTSFSPVFPEIAVPTQQEIEQFFRDAA